MERRGTSMRYIIWGTGGAARKFLNENLLSLLACGDISAVVDGNPQKTGRNFFGKTVVLPEQISYLQYDKIIVCSTFYHEIVREAAQLGVDTKKIISMLEMKKEIARYYLEICRLTQKRILVLGDNKYHLYPVYKEYFQNFSFLPIEELGKLGEWEYDYILLTELSNTEFNQAPDDELTLQDRAICCLADKLHISRRKILPSSIFMMIYANSELKVSYGEAYPDKTFLEIRFMGYAGWGYIFHVVSRNILYAGQKGYIPVVNMMTCHNTYLEEEEVGKVNAWEKFFEQPAGYTMEDVMQAKHVILAPQEQEGAYENRDFYQKLIMKPRLQKMFDNYMKTFYAHGQALGVLYRGTDYTNLKPYNHPVQPSLSMMLDKVSEKSRDWNLEQIYLCTEVEEAVSAFRERFGDKVFYYPQMRYSEDCNDYLGTIAFGRKEDAFYRGADYWILLNALSKCDSLVAGQCGGAHMAMELNGGEYRHVYQFDLGKYGVAKR